MKRFKLQTWQIGMGFVDFTMPKFDMDAGEFDTIEEATQAGDEARKSNPKLFYSVIDTSTGRGVSHGASRELTAGAFCSWTTIGIFGFGFLVLISL